MSLKLKKAWEIIRCYGGMIIGLCFWIFVVLILAEISRDIGGKENGMVVFMLISTLIAVLYTNNKKG